jgi:CheY-like chemotaxis protein
MRVLVVEDDQAMQRELVRAVQGIAGGEVVLAAESAQPAIDWLQAHPQGWDLAIVDMFLKQGHGFEVLRRCRRTLPHQRAVMLSNYAREPVAGYAQAAGADRFFDKSFDLEELIGYCRSLGAAIARPTALTAD